MTLNGEMAHILRFSSNTAAFMARILGSNFKRRADKSVNDYGMKYLKNKSKNAPCNRRKTSAL